MTNVDFHLQLNHNDTWSMSRLHFHDYCELLLPLTSPGNIFVNDQVYPLPVSYTHLVGLGDPHLTVGLDGLPAEVLIGDLLLGGLRQSLDLEDVIQHGVCLLYTSGSRHLVPPEQPV